MTETNTNQPKKDAEQMASQQREISISQFFEKNRHLLGYDNKLKALLTIVKEGVDNSLDATEESGILPDIYVKIEDAGKEKYKVVIRDNGPGVVKKQVPNIFGKLLYGSKFHRLKQSRGQQGIGISGCALYAQLTTGEHTTIITSTGDGKTNKYKLKIDIKKNEPVILEETLLETKEKWHGVQVSFIVEGIYREHKQSVLEYLKQVAIANPYANIVFDSPNGRIEFKRGVEILPKEPTEIKPHLHGVEVGIMTRMLNETKARSISGFLTSEFSRVGKMSADDICKKAGIDPLVSPKKLEHKEIVGIVDASKEIKLSRPPTDCLSPLGNDLIENGLKKELSPEWCSALSRPPSVYRGWPFQVEVGMAYGGSVNETNIMRFANRVPMLYQQGDCAITKSIAMVDWKRYKLGGNKAPEVPIAIFVHVVSVWVPFNSESKESIAAYPDIMKEIKLAVQDVARRLSIYLSGVRRANAIQEKKLIYERYAAETAIALSDLTGEDKKSIEEGIIKIVETKWSEYNEEPNGMEEEPQVETESSDSDDEESESEDEEGVDENGSEAEDEQR